ncbi:hypothetical protein [Streptomyces specialis]|uniref:hypothetical protein n=1 Tax=Streptomyces specialis TaxID=498367 RepID=UPI00073E24D3|nr:hypothetical protein [Streptomyces specialis]
MDDELAALAGAGAAALVAAMATDLWQTTRNGVAGLFGRTGRRRRAQVTAQLDHHAALVEGAAAPEDVRRALLGSWAVELQALLHREPSCREPLARLVGEARGARPDDYGGVVRAHLEQANTARDSGTVFAVQGGDQPVRWPGPGGPPPGPEA